jgi:exosortase
VVSDPENVATHSRTASLGWVAGGGLAVPLSIGAAALFAIGFRGLIGYDPATLPSHDLRGIEGLLFEPSGSAPAIIFPATAWLFFRRARRIRMSLGAPARPIAAALVLLLSLALATWSYYVSEATLLVPALSAAILGVALALGGFEAFRAVLLPALFLLFAVPIPAAVLNRFMYDLQLMTAGSVATTLSALGINAVAHADLIFRSDKVFQVIESCSGVRTISTLFMSAFLYHDLFFRSRLQSTLVVLSSLVIGVLVNELRVMSIVLNPLSRFAVVHSAQGLVMIAAGVLLISAVDSVLSRFLPPEPWWRHKRVERTLAPSRIAWVLAWSALLAIATVAPRPWQPPAPGLELASIPIALGGWAGRSLKLDREYLGSVAFSEYVHREYTRGDESVDVLVGSNRRLDDRIDFGSRKIALPGSGWEISSEEPIELASGRHAERFEVRGADGERRLVYRYTNGVEGTATELIRSAFALDRGPWRRPGRAFVAVLSTKIGSSEPPDERLRAIDSLVAPELARIAASDRG